MIKPPRVMSIGEWAYWANLPGTVQIKERHLVWYLPGHVMYEVEFKGKQYFVYDWELEPWTQLEDSND